MLGPTLPFLLRLELPIGMCLLLHSSLPYSEQNGVMSAQFWVSIVRSQFVSHLIWDNVWYYIQLCFLSEMIRPSSATPLFYFSVCPESEQGRRLLFMGSTQGLHMLFLIWINQNVFNQFPNGNWIPFGCLGGSSLLLEQITPQSTSLFICLGVLF